MKNVNVKHFQKNNKTAQNFMMIKAAIILINVILSNPNQNKIKEFAKKEIVMTGIIVIMNYIKEKFVINI